MQPLTFREFQHGSDDYRLSCVLREAVLRDPLGFRLTAADVAGDEHQRHFGLFHETGQIAACISAAPQSGGRVKFRQMAVVESSRGSGCGRNLITAAETLLHQEGCLNCILHARLSAAGFYEKLGYQPEGEEFTEVGIPHIRMHKLL